MRALVLKSTGSWYDVLADDGHVYQGRIRGRIRLEDIKETNPVAVGDYVEIETTGSGNEKVITGILPRENYIARKAVKKSGQLHVIAANIDLALLVVSISFPRTSLGFIDRFTVSAEAFRIPQVIVFNKRDLLDNDEKEFADALVLLYETLGIKCLVTSGLHDDQKELLKIIRNKKTLVTGHSGSGKSTLINKLSPAIEQRTAEVSEFTSKGTHTTTFAEMFDIGDSTYVIDTPGIKEMGMVDMKPEEVSDYFV
ncbi:MAG TPA: ribosome small subunit-dependent GTPase A, partial [Cyclobacteriaceae bacterium]